MGGVPSNFQVLVTWIMSKCSWNNRERSIYKSSGCCWCSIFLFNFFGAHPIITFKEQGNIWWWYFIKMQYKPDITLHFVLVENNLCLCYNRPNFSLKKQLRFMKWQLYCRFYSISGDFISGFYCIVVLWSYVNCAEIRFQPDSPNPAAKSPSIVSVRSWLHRCWRSRRGRPPGSCRGRSGWRRRTWWGPSRGLAPRHWKHVRPVF